MKSSKAKRRVRLFVIIVLVLFVAAVLIIGFINNKNSKEKEEETTTVSAEVGTDNRYKKRYANVTYDQQFINDNTLLYDDYKLLLKNYLVNCESDDLSVLCDYVIYEYLPYLFNGEFEEAYSLIPQDKVEATGHVWHEENFVASFKEFFSQFPEGSRIVASVLNIFQATDGSYVMEIGFSYKLNGNYYMPEWNSINCTAWDNGEDGYLFCPGDLVFEIDMFDLGIKRTY